MIGRDVRLGLRAWSRAPGVILVTVLSLGLGIGVATTVFSVATELLFSTSSGLTDPERIVVLYTSEPEGARYGRTSYPDYLHLEASLRSIDGVAASRFEPTTLGRDGSTRLVRVERVTRSYFDVLGVAASIGRVFGAADESFGADPVAVVSHEVWRRELGADPAVLGRTIELGGQPHTIVGVTPEGLDFGNPLRKTEVWLPLAPSPGSALAVRRDLRPLGVVARLGRAASLESLQAELDVTARALYRAHPDTFSDERDEARSLTALPESQSRLTPDRRAVLAVVSMFPAGIAILVLLVACSNVATIFLARAEQRAAETAVRLALGAGRGRLALAFLVESLVPAVASGAAGVALAWAALRTLSALPVTASLPVSLDVGVDAHAVAFALLLAFGCTLTFGIAPALTIPGSNPFRASGGVGRSTARASWRRALVVVQVAASLVLVVGAGLFYRSARASATLDLGFDPSGIAVTTRTSPEDAGPDEAARWTREVLNRLRAEPGVADAQASTAVELTLATAGEVPVTIGSGDGSVSRAFQNEVTPGYLEMLGFELLRGRSLNATDRPGAPRAAVVNDVFASRLWPDAEPLGRSFRNGANADFVVVGVVRDGKLRDIDDPPAPYFWSSLEQGSARRVAILVRGEGDATEMVGVLRSGVERRQGEVAMIRPTTLESLVDLQFAFSRIAASALGWGGGFGVLIAAIGIYGLVSFSVACRSRELAVRVAVGATKRHIVESVVLEGLDMALVGVIAGLAIVVPLARLLRAQLVGTSPADPRTLAAGAVLLVAVAVAASLGPARRAAAADPLRSLRDG